MRKLGEGVVAEGSGSGGESVRRVVHPLGPTTAAACLPYSFTLVSPRRSAASSEAQTRRSVSSPCAPSCPATSATCSTASLPFSAAPSSTAHFSRWLRAPRASTSSTSANGSASTACERTQRKAATTGLRTHDGCAVGQQLQQRHQVGSTARQPGSLLVHGCKRACPQTLRKRQRPEHSAVSSHVRSAVRRGDCARDNRGRRGGEFPRQAGWRDRPTARRRAGLPAPALPLSCRLALAYSSSASA